MRIVPGRTRPRTFIVLGGDNVMVAAGAQITVYAEHGPFATVSVDMPERPQFGAMAVMDYTAGQQMDLVALPRLSAKATAADAWNVMLRHSRSGVLMEDKSGQWHLMTAREIKRHRSGATALGDLPSRPVNVVDSMTDMLDRAPVGPDTAATDFVTDIRAWVAPSLPTVQILVTLEWAALLNTGPTECYCSHDPEHGYSVAEVKTLPVNNGGRRICTRDKTEVSCD